MGFIKGKKAQAQGRYDRKMLRKQENLAATAREADRLVEFNDEMGTFSASRGDLRRSKSTQAIQRNMKGEYDLTQSRDDYNLWMKRRGRRNARKGTAGPQSGFEKVVGATAKNVPGLKTLASTMNFTKKVK